MKGKSRFRIESHASFGVGIGARYGVILTNEPQLSDFLERAKSERFAGFSGSGKWVIGARKGVILP